MHDLDPNLGLPLWRSLVSYFRQHRPLVQAEQRLPAPPPQRIAAGSSRRTPMKERT